MTPSNVRFPRLGWIRPLLWLCVFIGVAAGIRSASFRNNCEQDNRRVEVSADFAELRTLAAASGIPIGEVLNRFKAAGLTSIAIQEETIAGLEESRQLTVVPISPTETQLQTTFHSPESETTLIRIENALHNKSHFVLSLAKKKGEYTLTIEEPWQTIRSYGIGLDPATVDAVHKADLGIVGRVNNWTGVSSSGLEWTLNTLKQEGVSTILFSGDEILGYKGYLVSPKDSPDTVSTESLLRKLNLFYGAVEFGKQKGDPELARAVPDQVVRVHTITGAEMLTETLPDAVQRFSLAARERNIRLLFVRLFLDERDAIDFNTAYIGKIVRSLNQGHLQTGIAHGYSPLHIGTVPRLLIGIAIGAGFLLLADAIFGIFSGGVPAIVTGACVFLSFLLIGLSASPISLGTKLAALAAAFIFPSLGLLANDLLSKETRIGAIGRFLYACFITFFGIICVVGLLADRIFLVKADAFIGIKATLAVPLLLTALVYGLDLRAREGRTFAQATRAAFQRTVTVFGQPILIWQIFAGGLSLALLFVVLARSGNESSVGVSNVELKIRAILDNVFLARPRFKDVFGHAAMVLALFLFQRTGRREWALPLFFIGVFGQASLLNTFCHLHTPLMVSLWRAFLGILLGGGIGLGLFAFLNHFLSRVPSPNSTHRTSGQKS